MLYNENENENELKLKVILVGSSGTGKSSIIQRYHNNTFTQNTRSTMSMNFISKKLYLNNKKIVANIWDTAGEEEFRSMNKLFIINSDIVIFVYDITNKKSFEDLDFWHKYIIDELGQSPYFALIGNKIDIYEKEEVREEEGEELANEWEAHFALLSAREENMAVNTFFEDIIKLYLEKIGDQEDKLVKNSSLTLEDYNENKFEDDNGCCSNTKKKN